MMRSGLLLVFHYVQIFEHCLVRTIQIPEGHT